MKINPYLKYTKNNPKKRTIKFSPWKILSIAAIILFIIILFWGIKKLGEDDSPDYEDVSGSSNSGIISPQLEDFKDEFQGDINKVVRRIHYSEEFEYSLPEDISKICFKNEDFGNMYFFPEDYGSIALKNVDINKTLGNSQSICFDVYDGKITLNLEKGYYGSKVVIAEADKKDEEPDENFEENITYICNGTWEQEYYWEGFYECDGNVSGCNISYCLCLSGFSPDLVGGCVLDYIKPDSNETHAPMTTVIFSRSSIAAKANREAILNFVISDVDGRDMNVFFGDVSDIGFEFLGNPGAFEEVSSGSYLLRRLIVPAEAYPGQHIVRVGAIPSVLLSDVINQYGEIPSLEMFPSLGFGIDEVILDVDGINYPAVTELRTSQYDNIEGTMENPYRSGSIRLEIFVLEDEGDFRPYSPSWGYQKISGGFCDSGARIELYGGATLTSTVLVPVVRTRTAIRLTGIIEDGIFDVSTTRVIYIDPELEGCDY